MSLDINALQDCISINYPKSDQFRPSIILGNHKCEKVKLPEEFYHAHKKGLIQIVERWKEKGTLVTLENCLKTASPIEEKIIRKIYEAFEGVKPGNGVSLHETIVIDRYGSETAKAKARALDEKEDWRKLINNSELANICDFGGPSFYDAEGMRFHLPAYMILGLQNPYATAMGSVIYSMTMLNDYIPQRFDILNSAQKNAVKGFLIYLVDHTSEAYRFDIEYIKTALANYWDVE